MSQGCGVLSSAEGSTFALEICNAAVVEVVMLSIRDRAGDHGQFNGCGIASRSRGPVGLFKVLGKEIE